MLDQSYLDAIKQSEGYSAKSRWDYAQNTNGYGTKALFAGEVIDKGEADRRFAGEIKKAADFVDTFAPNLDDGSKAALTSLTYNAGTAWSESGLGEAVASGDLEKAKSIFLQYNKAGGAVVDGLVQRRLQEVTWVGGGGKAAAPGPQMAAGVSPTTSGAADTNVGTAVQSPSRLPEAGAPKTAVASNSDQRSGYGTPVDSDALMLDLLTRVKTGGRQNNKEQLAPPMVANPSVA